MNTNQFETNIKTILDELAPIVFVQNKAPTNQTGPYTEFRFDTTLDMEPTYLITLVFSCFDSQNVSSKGNKDIADSIQNKFNKQVFNFEDTSVHSMMTLRQDIPSEMLTEKQVIELQFDLVLYQNKEVI